MNLRHADCGLVLPLANEMEHQPIPSSKRSEGGEETIPSASLFSDLPFGISSDGIDIDDWLPNCIRSLPVFEEEGGCGFF